MDSMAARSRSKTAKGIFTMNNDVMSHEQAVSKQAAERYLLAELSQEERDAFEGHYFDCQACFEQVQLGAEFLHHTRDVLDPEPEKGWLARTLGDLWRPAPAFVAAMMLLAVGVGVYQRSVIADLKVPGVESSYPLTGDARGIAKSISVPRNARVSLSLEFVTRPEFASYQAQIVSEAGKVEASLPVAAGQESVTISLLASTLEAGKYSMAVYGLGKDGSKTEANRGEFDLRFIK